MKINGNDIRPGNVIEHQNSLWRAVKTEHVKPGKGPAYLQVELKNLRDGRKMNERFRSSETVERVRLEQKDYQYLYEADGKYTFMDSETYDQVEIDGDLLGDDAVFLQDGMQVIVESHEGTPLGVILPDQVTLEVSETEPVVKGQTAASSNKPAILENGVRVMVPPFINVGDKVVVATADRSYVRRAD
ncbi:MAG: elongation factor P [Alphaproteobacteria bacterium]|nr:MAG: elongation factor P [Alphaproteobacteria bacterium]